MMKNIVRAGAVLAAMALASPVSAIVIDSADDGIINASDYAYVGQIEIWSGTSQYAASGVVIAPNWVLTAGHVVSDATALTFYQDGGGNFASFADRTGLKADKWFAHNKYDGSLGAGYDIGLIHFTFDDEIDLGPAAQLYTGSGEVGEIATAVGFGMRGSGATGATYFDGLKRAGDNTIDAIALTRGRTNRILLTDYDSIEAGYNSYGSSDPLPLESMTAPGDSGGGLFISCGDPNPEFDCLAGITSFGWGRLDGEANSDFGDVGGFTRVASFNNWISEMIGGGSSGGGGGKGGGPKKDKKGRSVNLGAGLLATTVAVPEPGTLAVFGFGLAALGFMRRRRAA